MLIDDFRHAARALRQQPGLAAVIILTLALAIDANSAIFTVVNEDLQRSLTTISGLSLMAGQTANLTGVAEPDRLRGGFVTAGFFDMLGARRAASVDPVVTLRAEYQATEKRRPEGKRHNAERQNRSSRSQIRVSAF